MSLVEIEITRMSTLSSSEHNSSFSFDRVKRLDRTVVIRKEVSHFASVELVPFSAVIAQKRGRELTFREFGIFRHLISMKSSVNHVMRFP
jgi:hypothetical protein